jgi:hypothetical protein
MNTIIKNIRLAIQQLSEQIHNSPKELVSWMGAIQAQDFNMAKWAIGIRLKSCAEKDIEDAFNRGDFMRTHIMRPTWHFVSSEDIRWLLELTGSRVKSACDSLAKGLNIDEKQYTKAYRLLGKVLRDNNHKTKEEIEEVFAQEGLIMSPRHINSYLMRAEADSVVCSGALKGKKQTYALLEERAPAGSNINKDEALAALAQKYMKSHSPASLQDFVWWSGLTIRDAKQAIRLIENELIKDLFDSIELYVHEAYKNSFSLGDDLFHFLSSYDEYIISYKNRTNVLDLEHHSKAFNNYGIFQSIILYNGHAVGNWKKIRKKRGIDFDITFWDKEFKANERLLTQAEERLRYYINSGESKLR